MMGKPFLRQWSGCSSSWVHLRPGGCEYASGQGPTLKSACAAEAIPRNVVCGWDLCD